MPVVKIFTFLDLEKNFSLMTGPIILLFERQLD
jgi:hypothetical protein